jgi:hypothetical protein
MPFKIIPLSKQPFKTQPQIENEDVTWSPQYKLPVTRTNKVRAMWLQGVELDGWFLILPALYWKQVSCNSCTSLVWVLHFISIFLDWCLGFEPTLQLKGLEFESPSKWNSYEGFNLEHWLHGHQTMRFWSMIGRDPTVVCNTNRLHVDVFLVFLWSIWGMLRRFLVSDMELQRNESIIPS